MESQTSRSCTAFHQQHPPQNNNCEHSNRNKKQRLFTISTPNEDRYIANSFIPAILLPRTCKAYKPGVLAQPKCATPFLSGRRGSVENTPKIYTIVHAPIIHEKTPPLRNLAICKATAFIPHQRYLVKKNSKDQSLAIHILNSKRLIAKQSNMALRSIVYGTNMKIHAKMIAYSDRKRSITSKQVRGSERQCNSISKTRNIKGCSKVVNMKTVDYDISPWNLESNK
jgi:hypothetical protein